MSTRPSLRFTPKKVLVLAWLAFVLSAFVIGWWQNQSTSEAASQAPAVLRLAVAANFLPATQKLAQEFTRQTGTPVQISSASSGSLYAQIRQGLPYDVFLSADTRRPDALLEQGLAEAGSALDYAIGQLIFWAPAYDAGVQTTGNIADDTCLQALKSGQFERVVLANPATAPYGQASQAVLDKIGLAETTLITAENISQAFRILRSGNADAGFIANSQWQTLPPKQAHGCFWPVPANWHQPLKQRAVLLTAAPNPAQGRAFLKFLTTENTRQLIRASGYAVE